MGFSEGKDLKIAETMIDRLEYHNFLGKEMAVIAARYYRKSESA